MIKQILLPKLDANTIEIIIREWYHKEKDQIAKGDKLLAIETDKAVIDVESEHSGVLLKILGVEDVPLAIPCVVALLGDSIEELTSPEFEKELIAAKEKKIPEFVAAAKSADAAPHNLEAAAKSGPFNTLTASPAARRLARDLGVDLAKIQGSGQRGEVTMRDVMALTSPLSDSMSTVKVTEQCRKVLVIGAGDGGYIISDILRFEPRKWELVGFLDDKESLWGQELRDCNVLGGTDKILKLKEEGFFDCAVISITSNMRVRKMIFEKHRALGIEFVNIIHPTVHINPSAKIGTSNLIYGMAYIGTETRIGDNNLISAHSSIDHHNKVGSHNLFGPGVLTSGAVTIGDSCIFGAGVGFEPHLKIGNNVKIASGLSVTSDIPEGNVMKSRFSVGV
jgi:sugar O-acyltransferase (sialic acid O-acetyltransferase NeuD family)